MEAEEYLTPEKKGAEVVEVRGCSDSRKGYDPEARKTQGNGFFLKASRRNPPAKIMTVTRKIDFILLQPRVIREFICFNLSSSY